VSKTDRRAKPTREFDAQAYLDSSGVSKEIHGYRRGSTIYTQGDPGPSVLYIQDGSVRLAVVSKEGKEVIIATFRQGDFLGEGVLTGQAKRVGTAVAATDCTILAIEKNAMARLLHEQHAFSDRFITYMLTRNCRIESDLIDQLFNSSEKRLARALLLLAQYGTSPPPDPDIVKVSQETLAKTIGTTRTRVNFFMNKFRKAGYVNYSGDGLKINSTLVNVLLHD
jgi:CRP-like cAMP-binding protein